MASSTNNADTLFLIEEVLAAAKMIGESDFLVASKDDSGDLVTSWDYAVEKYLIGKIHDKYPGFDIVSEEFNPTEQLTENCFVIDPLDGTINFAHGLPLWGIQVAIIRGGKVTASTIYLPKLYELFFANDDGAFMVQNPVGTAEDVCGRAKRIEVSKRACEKSLYLVEGHDKFAALGKLKQTNRNWRYICCTAVNSAWVACGRLGGTILRKDHIWDYVPGQFLITQAGGVVINEKGAHIVANCPEMAKLLLEDGRTVG